MDHPGICERNLQATRHSRSRHSSKSSVPPTRPGSRRGEMDGAKSKRATFAEDFLLEHSHSTIRIGVFQFAESLASEHRETLKSAQSYGFPS